MSNNIQRIFKPCKTRQLSFEFRTDWQSYSEVDKNNYGPSTAYIFMVNANGKNLHILLKRQNAMPINESYTVSYFEFSIRKFTDKLPCLWHLLHLKLLKMGRKLLQSLEVLILEHELSFYKESVSARVGKSSTKCFFLNLALGPCRKNNISGYIWPRSFIQMVQCSLLDKRNVY